jgi:outer membrane autotransporter protein
VIDRKAHTHHGGWDIDGHVDGGLIIDQWKQLEFRPFFAFDCLFLHENAFREKGANSLNLAVRASNNTMLRSEVGVNFSRCFTTNHGKWIPQARASVVDETFFSNGEFYRSSFVGQPGSFTVKNPTPNRILFSPGAGISGAFYDDRMLMSFDYNGEFGSRYTNQVVKTEFSWMF